MWESPHIRPSRLEAKLKKNLVKMQQKEVMKNDSGITKGEKGSLEKERKISLGRPN